MPLKEWFPSSDDLGAKPWGLWTTMGFSVIVFALFTALQFLVMNAFVAVTEAGHPELDLGVDAKNLSSNGFYIAIMTVVSGLLCTPQTYWLQKPRGYFRRELYRF